MTAHARLFVVVLVVGIVGCTRTEDHLRKQLTAHSELVDPGSATFRNIKYKHYLWDIWCGELNAKNRMGGYVGWTPFSVTVHDDGKVFVTILQPQEAPFGASAKLEQATADLNKTMAEIYASECKDAAPAPKWVPFWK